MLFVFVGEIVAVFVPKKAIDILSKNLKHLINVFLLVKLTLLLFCVIWLNIFKVPRMGPLFTSLGELF